MSWLAVAGLAVSGCGKKGPPLAPLLLVPGRAADLTARRTGQIVTLTFTVPSANVDQTRPADIARVEVYAYTALLQNDVRDTRNMTLVATIPVRRPPDPDKKPGSARPREAPEPGEEQGAVVTVTETLDEQMLTPAAPGGKKRAAPPEPRAWFDTPPLGPLCGPVARAEPSRFYVVYGVNRGGRKGAASPRLAVPLAAPPPAPDRPSLEVTEGGVVVNWAPPPGTRLPYQEPAQKSSLAGTYRGGMEAAPSLAYVVYLVPAARPAAGAGPEKAASGKGPSRLTDKPIVALTWTDTGVAFGVERCYQVRTATVHGIASVESDPSPTVCVTPADTFAPPAPAALSAVAGEGAISLIWEGVETADLAGYLVLRAEAPDGALRPLFDAPLRETTFRDETARPGVRYIYAVVAVDRATPANRSPLSNKVEETAR